jgi:hypothetical protein
MMGRTIEVADAVGESFTGELIGPADPAYEQARRVHNGLIDKRPALIDLGNIFRLNHNIDPSA